MTLLQNLCTYTITGLVHLLTGVQARWHFVPDLSDPCIYFANHSSHLDGVVIWTSLVPMLRARTRPVAAQDYWNAGALRRYLSSKVFNVLLIDRSPANTMEERQTRLQPLLSAVDANESLILFPEGTRGSGDTIAAFKSGLFHLARQRPGINLVPVYLENLNRVLPKGSSLVVPMLCSATFGKPIRLLPGESRDAFLARAYQSLMELAS